MLGDTAQGSGGSRGHGRRSGRPRRRTARTIRAAGLAALAASALLAATAAGTPPPGGGATMFVHSATSGELGGGRLTLHGVSRRVTWAHNSGRSGVMAVSRMHRRLYSAGKPSPVGTLHVAGHRGGDELTFELTKPRYNAARHTVSYRIKRLGNGHLPRRAAHAAGAPQRRKFGDASLSIVGGANAYFTSYRYQCVGQSGDCSGISGSGLVPGSPVTIAPAGGESSTYQADQNGTVDIRLGKLCGEYFIQADPANGQPINPGLDVPC